MRHSSKSLYLIGLALFLLLLALTACSSSGGDDDGDSDDDSGDDDSGDDDDDTGDDDSGDDDDDTGTQCDPPAADFEAAPRSGSAPLGVAFTDQSQTDPQCPITSWSWDFGDGGAGGVADPTHTYEIGGTFTVSLTVQNEAGSDTETKTGYVIANCPIPVADFSGAPLSGYVPLTINFSDQSVTRCPGVAYAWDFGDGGTSNQENPTYEYTADGTYAVSLTITSDGGVDSETKANYVTGTCQAPTANFSANRTSGRKPLDVNFYNTSSSYCTITSFSWVFGDGGTSTLQNPSNRYLNVGQFTVSLTVANNGGMDAETKSNYIVTKDNPLVGLYELEDARDVVTIGGYAYIANGESGFEIVNISNPADPQFAWSGSSRSKTGIDVVGNYAYLADPNIGDGIFIYNVSVPGSTSLVGEYTEGGLSIHDVIVSDDYDAGPYAFCAAGGRGLYVLDVSNPADPDYETEIDPGGYANGVTFTEYEGTPYAILALGSTGIAVFDVTDPTDPIHVATFDTYEAEKVFVSDRYGFVAESSQGLTIVDLFGINPEESGNYHHTNSFSQDVVVSGNFAYLADYGSGVTVVDVSNPKAPVFKGAVDTNGYASGLFLNGSTLYVADGSNGLVVVNVATPSSPVKIGGYNSGSIDARDVWVKSGYAYIANGEQGFLVLNVSTPSSPTFAWSGSSRSKTGIHIVGNYAYLADPNIGDGLYVYNISTPSSPTQAGSYTQGGLSVSDVFVSGNYAYLAAGGRGLYVINVSSPGSPSYVAEIDPGGYATKVHVVGQYAILAIGSDGIAVIDVSDPAHPKLEGTEVTYNAESVVIQGAYGYLAEGSQGLTILDVFGVNPEKVGNFHDSNSFTQDVFVRGNYAYLADYSSGLTVVNITNLISPVLADRYNTNGYSSGVFVLDPYVYVADQNGGLAILHTYPTHW